MYVKQENSIESSPFLVETIAVVSSATVANRVARQAGRRPQSPGSLVQQRRQGRVLRQLISAGAARLG